MTNYYDVSLKESRNSILKLNNNFNFYLGSTQDENLLNHICTKHKPDIIMHLAAQAGVRHSIKNPKSYVEANLVGTFSILEIARKFKPKHLLISSTSSVYGNNLEYPFHEKQKSDTPISFYAATKKSNEVMAHSYSHLYKIPITIFRFFTVFGPWGRPDMALFQFTKNILSKKTINLYNNGDMKRDFTYIEDLIKAIYLLKDTIPHEPSERKLEIEGDSISKTAPFRIVNIGNSKSIKLLDFVNELEKCLGMKANKNFIKIQDGDIKETHSNIELLNKLTGFKPEVTLSRGIKEFVEWYKNYYKEL